MNERNEKSKEINNRENNKIGENNKNDLSEEDIEEDDLSEQDNLKEEPTKKDVEIITNNETIFQNKEDIAPEKQSDEELREILRNLVEGALYAAGRSLSIEEISTKLNMSKIKIEELLNELLEIYNNRSSAITIINIGEKYQMQIKSEYSEKISQFAQGGAIAEKYLRTLTIIALKQPILKSIVIKIRGTGAYEHIKFLEENGFIISDKKGRSSELSTTDKYAEMFGLPRDRQEMKKIMIEKLGINQKS